MRGETLGDVSRGGDPRFESEAKFLSRVKGELYLRYEGDEELFSKRVCEGEFFSGTIFFFLCVLLGDASKP